MLTKVTKNNAEKLAKYISGDRIFSLVMKDDVLNYNYNNQDISFYFISQDTVTNVVGVAFCIDKIHLYYSKEGADNAEDYLKLLQDKSPLIVAGSIDILSKLNSAMPQNEYSFAKQEVLVLQNTAKIHKDDKIKTQKATENDIEDLCKLMNNMGELSELYSFEAKEKYGMKLCENDGRVYISKDEQDIICAAETAFEKQKSAYICDVCTIPSFRNRGIATAVVKALCAELLKENKTVWISFDNPKAGKIYKEIGFKKAGDYAIMQFNG